MEEVTADGVETAREPEGELEPEDGADSLHLRIKLEGTRRCFLWRGKECGFLRWNLLLVKVRCRLVERHRGGDLEHHIDGAAGLRGWTPIWKDGLLWVKFDQTAPPAAEKSRVKGRVHGRDKRHSCLS